MSIIDEAMFGGDLVGDLRPSGYVDGPRVCVELLSHYWSQPGNQQEQQGPKDELREPEPVAGGGRWQARSHEFLRARRLSYRPGLRTVHAGAQRDKERGRSQLTWRGHKRTEQVNTYPHKDPRRP